MEWLFLHRWETLSLAVRAERSAMLTRLRIIYRTEGRSFSANHHHQLKQFALFSTSRSTNSEAVVAVGLAL